MVLTLNSRQGGGGTPSTEAVQDIVGPMIVAAGGSYNDAAGTITIPTGAAGNQIVVAGSDAPAAVIARAQYTCDGTADEVQLHLAFAQAATDKAEVWLVGTFSVAAEVTVPTGWVNPVIRGIGYTYTGGVTTITAAGAMRSVLRVSNKYSKISDIKLLGAFVASYACFLDGAEGSTFERVCFGSGNIDGVHLSRTINFAEWTAAFDGSHVGSNNNGIIFLECFGTDNGMLYATTGIVGQYSGSMRTTTSSGTVSVTSGSQTVTGSGTSFVAMGARKGDILRVGATAATAQYLQIQSVDSNTQITTTVWRTATATVAGSTSWAIGVGNGYHEERHLDNNLSIVRGGLWRNNGGSGLRFCGLYGPRVEVVQTEYNGSYGISIGTGDNDGQVRFTRLDHVYFEGNISPAPVLCAMAYGITIDQPVWDTAVGTVHVGLASQNLGIAIDQRGITPIGEVTSMGRQPYVQVVAYASSITPNAALGALVRVGSLTGTLTINAPTGMLEGDALAFYLPQDATGGRVVTFNSVFKNPPVIDATAPASAHDLAAFVYVNSVWVRSRV